MKKIIVLITAIFFLTGCKGTQTFMPNPWTDCKDNLEQASKIAGFKFSLILSNYSVHAMKNMIEITYPLDDTRYVTVRKSDVISGDISGDYNNYTVNKEITLSNGVRMNVRGDKDKIYVVTFAASSGYYSASCSQGLTMNEIQGIYEIIAEAETPKFPDNY